MKVVSIADEIRRELDDSSLSTPSISYWIVNNIGDLNNLIATSFQVSEDSIDISPELNVDEKAILKKLYSIYFYDKKIRSFLGVASQDIILEVSSDGGTVRTVNKNEISKSYIQMKKLEQESLDKLVKGYNNNSVAPVQVCGDEELIEVRPRDYYQRR